MVDSWLWWLGGIAVLIGVMVLIGLLAWWVDHRVGRWQERHGRQLGTFEDDKEDD